MCSKGVHKSANMNGNLCDNISRTPCETNISSSYKFQLLQLTKSYKICRLNIKRLYAIAYKIGISESWSRRYATGFLDLSENEHPTAGGCLKPWAYFYTRIIRILARIHIPMKYVGTDPMKFRIRAWFPSENKDINRKVIRQSSGRFPLRVLIQKYFIRKCIQSKGPYFLF